MTDLGVILEKYGWATFMLYVLARDIFPFFRDRVYPQQVKVREAERQRLIDLENRAAKNEERLTVAVETMSKSVTDMAMAITTNNERLSHVISNQLAHSSFTEKAINDMRVQVASAKSVPQKRRQ